MSWKKSTISYLIWILYMLVTATSLASLGGAWSVEAGFAAWWGILAAALYMAAVGGLVFLLYRMAGAFTAFAEKHHMGLIAVESVLAAGLLALGCFLRVQDIGDTEGASLYFEMAEVVAGQRIPQMVHGASYFYVQLLHGVFLLLGNQYAAGIGLQIALQLAASVVLYFVVRNLSGAISALAVFGFCMCAPFMLQGAQVFSPGMLYFLFLAAAAGLALWAFGGKLRSPAFAFIGVLSALCCYIDINGVLLILLAVALAFSQQAESAAFKRRLACVGICLLAAAAGLLAFIWADAFMSGKDFGRVAGAWLELYRPEGFGLPVTVGPDGPGWESAVLAGLMAFGVFGFWRDRRRDFYGPYVVAACVVMLGVCFGIYTDEMPGFYSLYLMFAILAGVGLKQCICQSPVPGELPVPVGEVSGAGPGGGFAGVLEGEEESGFAGVLEGMGEGSFAGVLEGTLEGSLAGVLEGEEESGFAGVLEGTGGGFAEDIAAAGRENGRKAVSRQEKEGRRPGSPGEPGGREEKKVQYLENPLPLPKKHVKRVMDYSIQVNADDDFDFQVQENDDFDV